MTIINSAGKSSKIACILSSSPPQYAAEIFVTTAAIEPPARSRRAATRPVGSRDVLARDSRQESALRSCGNYTSRNWRFVTVQALP